MQNNVIPLPKYREGDKVWYCGYGIEGVGKIKEILWFDREGNPWEYRMEDKPFSIPEDLLRPESVYEARMNEAHRRAVEEEFGPIAKDIILNGEKQ